MTTETVKLQYTIEECDEILSRLGKCPYELVASIIESILVQGRPQANAILAAREEAKKAAEQATEQAAAQVTDVVTDPTPAPSAE